MSEAELVRRLEKVERDNRRLKAFAVGILIIAAALGGIYAAEPVPQRIRAHGFDVVDNGGMVRASMEVRNGVASTTLRDAQGNPGAAMLIGPSGNPAFMLAAGTGKVLMRLNSTDEPDIMLADPRGFVMDLGNTQTVLPGTGVTQETSVASIVMFGNDHNHHVIWRAP